MDQRSARRLLGAALVIGLCAQALLFRTALGVNVALLVASLLAAALLLKRGAARVDVLDLWIAPAALIFAGFISVRADPVLVGVDALLGVGLGLAAVMAIGGARLTRRSALGLVAVAARTSALLGAGAAEPVSAARPASGAETVRRGVARSAPVLRGLALAFPAVIVFAGLFAAADAVFSRAVSDVLSLDVEFGDLPARLLLAALIAWPVAGVMVSAVRDVFPFGDPVASLRGGLASTSAGIGRLGLTEAIVVLALVDALFAVFVGLQVAYLFGGRDTLAATGLTYADYARRGFFELVAVAVLAGGLIAGLELVVSRRSRTYVAAAVTLACLTLVVLASAALRLKLYQDAYGWTELRFYVYAAITWLGVGAIATIALLVAGRTRWLAHVLGILAFVVLLGANVIGPEGFIARQNLARVVDPSLVAPGGQPGIDAAYFVSLGDDAVPVMIEALPVLGADDRLLVDNEVRARAAALGQPDVTAWPAWNLARERARQAIASVGR